VRSIRKVNARDREVLIEIAKITGGGAEGGKPRGHQLSSRKWGVHEHPHVAETKLLKVMEHSSIKPFIEDRIAVCVAG
jgi:hypothetical protein